MHTNYLLIFSPSRMQAPGIRDLSQCLGSVVMWVMWCVVNGLRVLVKATETARGWPGSLCRGSRAEGWLFSQKRKESVPGSQSSMCKGPKLKKGNVLWKLMTFPRWTTACCVMDDHVNQFRCGQYVLKRCYLKYFF